MASNNFWDTSRILSKVMHQGCTAGQATTYDANIPYACWFASQLLHFCSSSLLMFLKGQYKMGQVNRPLPPTWKTHMELPTTSLGLAQSQPWSQQLRPFGQQATSPLLLCDCLSLSASCSLCNYLWSKILGYITNILCWLFFFKYVGQRKTKLPSTGLLS